MTSAVWEQGFDFRGTAGYVLDPPGDTYVLPGTIYPTTGPLSTYGTLASGPIGSGLSWQSRVAYAHANDQFVYDTYNSFIGDLWLPWSFSVPGSSRPWTLTPSGGVTTWKDAAEFIFRHAVA